MCRKMTTFEYTGCADEFNYAEILKNEDNKISIFFEAELDVNELIEYIVNQIKVKTAAFKEFCPFEKYAGLKRYKCNDISVSIDKYICVVNFGKRIQIEFPSPKYKDRITDSRITLRYIEEIGECFKLYFVFRIFVKDNEVVIDFYPTRHTLDYIELKYDLNSFETPCYINELVKLLNFWKKTVYEIFEK